MSGFALSKWYADCVTGEGDALILYSAELRWRGPVLHYSSLLTHRGGKTPRCRYSLRRQPPPEARDDGIAWHSRAWQAEGHWSEPGPAIRRVLFESGGGTLEWECIAPRSVALIRIGRAEPLCGLGYVERLRLSVEPWCLPIHELRWGRFIGGPDALVWIDWRGPHNVQAVFLNGTAVSAQAIGEREVVLADGLGALALEPGAVLREGALAATALSAIPGLQRLFPERMLNVRERKWLSRARLRRPGRADSAGFAIHEVVEWP